MADHTPTWFEVREQVEHNTIFTADEFDRMIDQERAEALRDTAAEADAWEAAGGMHGGEWFPSEWAGQVAGWLEHRADQIEKEAGL